MNSARRIAGFSILEVMCAILVLGVGIAGLTQGIGAALRSNKESQVQTSAALIAAGQIELLRAEGLIVAGSSEGECGESLPGCNWVQTIRETQPEGLYEIDVSVEESKTGKTLFALKTLLFDPPSDSALSTSEKKKNKDPRKRRRQN